MFVLHWTGGPYAASVSHLTSAASGASAHYILDRDGSWTQLVRECDTAWHAGESGVNRRSIGIEVVSDPANAPTEEQYAALVAYLRAKALEYGIELYAAPPASEGAPQHPVTVRRHREIVPTLCPGTLDIERVIREVNGTPPDWNGQDWWQALSERERWLKYVDVDGANKHLNDVEIPRLRQRIGELEAMVRAAHAKALQLTDSLVL